MRIIERVFIGINMIAIYVVGYFIIKTLNITVGSIPAALIGCILILVLLITTVLLKNGLRYKYGTFKKPGSTFIINSLSDEDKPNTIRLYLQTILSGS